MTNEQISSLATVAKLVGSTVYNKHGAAFTVRGLAIVPSAIGEEVCVTLVDADGFDTAVLVEGFAAHFSTEEQ